MPFNGQSFEVTEDAIEIEDKSDTLNAILKIVALFTYSYATVASAAALLGECHYSESSSFVFDEQTDPSPYYRKEIVHMSRYFRLHLGSFLAIEFAMGLNILPKRFREQNRFESVIELYESECA